MCKKKRQNMKCSCVKKTIKCNSKSHYSIPYCREYEARLEKYNQRIWTCKSTGSSQLTHKEAWEEEQEVAELLKEEFPVWYEKLVLEMVHHNTISLEKLVDSSWLEIMTKFAVGEECDFEVGKEKVLRVKVVKIHPLEKTTEEETAEKKTNGACDSPSSDKENSSQVVQDNPKVPALKEDDSRRESLSEYEGATQTAPSQKTI
ncbi:Tyrosine-protein kinase BAZ1B [Varanus komodoensis]|nr:Tyrosine-protein kinase BAZ1B [Varanus komodoensis]